ncbi:hypothetical protein HaLaN_24791 [Haematococcus lacustris]|uniref:LisH domain-containing protein n=1 Tax=Haematococcus lacustris TaxID=44745 RepID=A0A699ZX82_HAELA|nr:hypothetical protein HaLaN_24791 [Haematococcus lacustris]
MPLRQALPPQVVPQVVRDYLHHCGYAASLAALDSALLCPGLPEPLAVPLQGGGEAEAGCLALRQAVRQRLMAGECQGTLRDVVALVAYQEPESVLERLLAHTCSLQQALTTLSGGQGELMRLDQLLDLSASHPYQS